MSEPADWLRDWWETNIGQELAPGVTGLVDKLGTAGVAHELGVAQRTVQRWTRYERGEHDANARNPEKSPQAEAIAQLRERESPDVALDMLQMHGLIVAEGAQVDYSFNQDVDRYLREDREIGREVYLSPSVLDDLIAAAQQDDWQSAAAAFDAAFWESPDYTAPGGLFVAIHDMDMRIGG